MEPAPHLHCFKCGKHIYDKEIVETYMTETNPELLKLLDKDTEHRGNTLKLDRVKLAFPLQGCINALTHRGITLEVARRYKVETLYNEHDEAYGASFPGFTHSGEYVAQKVKRFDKRMTWIGEPKKTTMFGMNLFPAGGKYLTITEGEEDAMAAFQMLQNGKYESAVISLFNGASSAEKECKENWEYINSFENIIICFDGDEQGRSAAEKVTRLFNFKPRTVLFSECRYDDLKEKYILKDANDYLLDGKAERFKDMWWKAEKLTPKGVKTFQSLLQDITKEETNTTVPYPWEGLNDKLHGMTTGHFVGIKAPPKVGKCFGKDTPIRMYSGKVKLVQDIKEGELLMGDDGTPRRVQGVTSGVEKMYVVRQNKGLSYTVNASHILSLKNTDTKEIRDINLLDYLALPQKERWKGYKAPILKEEPINLFGLDPYFIGLWLGDGTQGEPEITTTDAEIINYLNTVTDAYGLTLKQREDITYHLSGHKGTRNPITESLRQLGILNNKKIPDGFITAPKDVRLSILAGLLDSDGYRMKKDGRGYEISQVRQQLALGIYDLGMSLGFRVGMNTEQKSCLYKGEKVTGTYYRITMFGDFSEVPLKLSRKKAEIINKRNRDCLITGIHVEELNEDTYYGFELDGNHRFLLSDGTVVHNTSLLKELAYHVVSTSPYNVGIVFLENTKKEIGLGLCSLKIGKPIKPWEVKEHLDEVLQAHQELSENDRIMIFDPEDERTAENIMNKIMYFVKAHDCRFVFLDHITMMSYQNEDDDRKFLDKLCADLKQMTTTLDIFLCVVSHVNDEGKTRGSRALPQLCESLIAISRDKTSSDPVEANTTTVIVEENRWGECGLACKLFYDSRTGRMTEIDTSMSMDIGHGKQVTFDK